METDSEPLLRNISFFELFNDWLFNEDEIDDDIKKTLVLEYGKSKFSSG